MNVHINEKKGLDISTINSDIVAEIVKKKGTLPVEIRSYHGVGAKLEWALEIMAFCEENQLTPQFRFTYPNSDPEVNYFDSFFELRNYHGSDDAEEFIIIGSIHELGLSKSYDPVLNLELAAALIDRHLRVKDSVLTEVDSFCSEHFDNKDVLGIHYRGTDKASEAQPVSFDKVVRNINFYIEKFPETSVVFLSSDEEKFIRYFENNPIARPVVFRNDKLRSKDNTAVHFSCPNYFDMNVDALVNCLILSRCDALMKTASILSGWSRLFNPQLPLIMLNEPFDKYFPERDLLDVVLYEPVQ